jgi:serine protease Do
MACALLISVNLAWVLAYCSMLASPLPKDEQSAEATLVRVNIITETRGAKGKFEVNGKEIEEIIQDFPSTGIVIDQKGVIMTFLGYRWVDIQNRNLRVEITTGEGQKLKGKLIGIDQTNSVAVIKTDGKLKKTPICSECEIKDGDTIAAPVISIMSSVITELNQSQNQIAKIRSVGMKPETPAQGSMTIGVDRLLLEVGQPILTTDHRVLGFIAGLDPVDLKAIMYPIDRMIASAEKILKAGGDIRAGWLGVLLLDAPPDMGAGVAIMAVEPDSPAQKSGLRAWDLLQKYNGKEIQSVREFVQMVEGTSIGSKAGIEITRQGKPMSLTATIEERKLQPDPNRLLLDLYQVLTNDSPQRRVSVPQPKVGLEVEALNPSQANILRLPVQTGLLITYIVEQSPAERAGFRFGDVIVTVNGQRFADPESLMSYITSNSLGSHLIFKIIRKGAEKVITFQIPE